jgi:DNA-binding MarR family transcriptional regulator
MRSGSYGERHPSLDAKIVGALDRVGEALGVLARRSAAAHDLSVTQMRVLARLHAGPPPEALSSELAHEFDVSDPTISDALAALRRKGLIGHTLDPADRRRRILRLTAAGRRIGQRVTRWTAPAEVVTSAVPQAEGEALLSTLLDLLARMQQAGLLSVSRSCTTCAHFSRDQATGRPVLRCGYFGSALRPSDLRVDCAAHAARQDPE